MQRTQKTVKQGGQGNHARKHTPTTHYVPTPPTTTKQTMNTEQAFHPEQGRRNRRHSAPVHTRAARKQALSTRAFVHSATRVWRWGMARACHGSSLGELAGGVQDGVVRVGCRESLGPPRPCKDNHRICNGHACDHWLTQLPKPPANALTTGTGLMPPRARPGDCPGGGGAAAEAPCLARCCWRPCGRPAARRG